MTEFKRHFHYDQDIEAAIIGTCLVESHSFARTYGLIKADDFYFDKYREVYVTMQDMYEHNVPIDTLTVIDELIRKRGKEEFFGESVPYFLVKCTNAVCASLHLEYHCHILQSFWVERELLKLTMSGPGDGNSREKIINLQTKLMQLNSSHQQKEWYDMSELMIGLFQHREKMKVKGPGIPTGIKKLDQTNGGLMQGDMYVIGARPSVGKSAFAGMIAWNMAQKGIKVGIISLEMSNAKVAGRLASLDTNTDFHVIYRGLEMDERHQQDLYTRIARHTSNLPIFVSDKTGVNVHEIKAKAMKLKHSKGLDCLIIDYLQLIDGDGTTKNRTRENEVTQMSKGMKLMAKDMEIPVIVLAQLNREVTNRKGNDRYPKLSDLRESGSIEQDADGVMFLHRDWMSGIEGHEDGSSTEREADLIIRKWRDGEPNLHIPLDFDPPKMKFTERKVMPTWKPVAAYTQSENDDQPF